jgi:hypothetical protein
MKPDAAEADDVFGRILARNRPPAEAVGLRVCGSL